MPALPRGGRRLLPDYRIVAYYGAAGDPNLGVLGDAPPNRLWPRLSKQAAPYGTTKRPVLPAYELITFAAQGAPGRDGDYSARVSDVTIGRYLAAARAHHALLILDIQPGRSTFLPDARSLAHWLAQPDVGLALDPEWKLHDHQVPDRQIGHTSGTVVNQVSAWLNRLTARDHLPQKLLMIHQFTHFMVANKHTVAARPHLAMVFNMDGFGSRPLKLTQYRQLIPYPQFGLGMKLFYNQDTNMFDPADLLALDHPPDVIDYQ